MRPHISLFTITGILLASMQLQAAPTYVAADNSRESKLCVSAAMESRIGFRMDVEYSGIMMRTVANHLSCNDQPVAEFAQAAGNTANAAILQRYYTPKTRVEIREANTLKNIDNRWSSVEPDSVIRVGGTMLN